MNSQDSQELQIFVEQAKNGNKEAFREIFEHLNTRIFTYVLSRTPSRDEALDITQEIFIDLWGALKKFKYRSKEEFYGFVFKITKRRLYQYYKRRRADVPLDEKFINDSYEMKIDDYQYLFKHINTLALKYQELLKLRYWSEMTFSEIASFLNIKETTAKVRHYRAIKKLQISLEKYENTI